MDDVASLKLQVEMSSSYLDQLEAPEGSPSA